MNTDLSDQNVGRSIKALHDNGWHVGKITYYNKTLQKYKIDYQDNSIDYISPSKFEGAVYFVDVKLKLFPNEFQFLSLGGVLKMFLIFNDFLRLVFL